jgi:hypothetical protein
VHAEVHEDLHAEVHGEASSQTDAAPVAAPVAAGAPESREADAPMFAEEGHGASSWFNVPPPVQETIQETVREAVQEVAAESASRPAPDFGHEILVAPADADHSSHSGQGESVPDAVASLFSTNQASEQTNDQLNGRPAEQSEYVPHQDEVPVPTQHLLPPPPDAEELLIHAEAALIASDSNEYNERIPTAPPPNREALAGIPFLTPPPAAAPMDSSAIDAVVQRVLEKLGPQLHDLLSKGVLKPLIEDLLHQELDKKDK